MISFRRYCLLTEMTREEAFAILGASPREDLDSVKDKYRALALKFHPDQKDPEEKDRFFQIQTAWEIINGRGKSRATQSHQGPSPAEPRGIPPWQTDPRSTYNTISRQDFTNLNFVKFSVWDAATKTGGVQGEYFVQAFDGHFLRHGTTVFGNDQVLGFMGEAVGAWNSSGGSPHTTGAVIATKEGWGKRARVIRIRGEDVSAKDIWVEHDSFNANPENDQSFLRKLRELVANYRG